MGAHLAVPTSSTLVADPVDDNPGYAPSLESDTPQYQARDIPALDLESLYSTYANRLRHFCRWHLNGNAEDAEDACHETILRAFAALRDSQPVAIWPWLMTIASHVCVGIIRQRSRVRYCEEIGDKETGDDSAPNEEALALREEIVTKALGRIAPRYRECLLLHSFEGWSCDDIARLEGITPGAVASLLSRARRALKIEVMRTARAMGQWPLPAP